MIQDANGGFWQLGDQGRCWEYVHEGRVKARFSIGILQQPRAYLPSGSRFDVFEREDEGTWTVRSFTREELLHELAGEEGEE